MKILSKKWLRWAWIGFALVLVVWMGRSCSIGKLPSDQAMIDHFYAHKNEFNALVQIYGEYNHLGFTKTYMDFLARPDVIKLMSSSGVGHITGGVGGIWLDDPYSLESAKKLEEMYKFEKYSISNYRRIALVKMEDGNKYSAVYFFDGGDNWKDYVYIPVDPEIIQGRVRLARDFFNDEKPHLWLRVLDSLDSVQWKRGECVLKKIEPKWFLRRCRAS